MTERTSVFISSTSRDLLDYREAVAKVILRLGMYPIDMATFNPTDANALQLCYDKVCEAEIFIGIYAHRYGYAPNNSVTCTTTDGKILTGDGETGITHLEYLWALERKLPMLLFMVSDTDAVGNPLAWPLAHVEDEPGKTRLKTFKNLIMSQHVVGFFYSPDHLATQVATGLSAIRVNGTYWNDKPGKPLSHRRDFYRHIQLPPNYVSRHELLADLRLALTTGNKESIALHGMGGIGKSVMARALCDDTVVQESFADGILWTTLGYAPDLSAKLREWIEVLGGTVSENVPTVDNLKANLAGLLEQRACLLIVDDIWQKKHIETFRVGGRKCRLLLTTRDTEVARSMGALVQPVPTMQLSESLDLIREWADGALKAANPDLLTKIVNKLGRLPLALKLAGAQLQKKSPDRWLERFDARKLEARRGDDDDPHSSLERCFGMSLSELETTERKLYAALSIFREDEPIREIAIRKLWAALGNFDEDEIEDLLDDLVARALLEVVGDEFPRAAILHDLLREFMGQELDNPKVIHETLLGIYRENQTGEGWHTVSDDGYVLDHLVYHLESVGDTSGIRALFLDQHWLSYRVASNNYEYDGYIRDLETAWNIAHKQTLEDVNDPIGIDFAACFRYALIRTSINSLSGNFVGEIIVRAVELGLWTLSRAESIVARVPDRTQQIQMCVALLALEGVDENKRDRIKTIWLNALRGIRDEVGRVKALQISAPVFDQQFVDQVLEIILNFQNIQSRVDAFTTIARLLNQHRRDVIALSMLTNLDQIEEPLERLNTKLKLILSLSDSYKQATLAELLDQGQNLEDPARRISALVPLIPHLSVSQRQPTIEFILSLLTQINVWYAFYPPVFAALAPFFTEEQYKRSRIFIASIPSNSERCKSLVALIPFAPLEAKSELQEAIWHMLDLVPEEELPEILSPFITESSPNLLHQILERVRRIKADSVRSQLFAQLVPYLSPALITDILSSAFEMTDNWSKTKLLVTMIQFLSPDQKNRAVAALMEIAGSLYPRPRVWSTIALIAPVLSAESLQQLINIILAVEEEGIDAWQKKSLGELASYLDSSHLNFLLERLQKMDDEPAQIEALNTLQAFSSEQEAALETRLVPPDQPQSREMQFATLQQIENPWRRARELANFLPELNGDLRSQALNAAVESALQIDHDLGRARILCACWRYADEKSILKMRIVEAILGNLRSYSDRNRETLLAFYNDKSVFGSGVLPAETLLLLASQISEICKEWTWL